MRKLFLSMALVAFVSLQASGQGMESLKIIWPEEYQWKIGSNQENETSHLMELIPGNESIDQWTIMGTMMSVKAVKASMDDVMNLMFNQAKQNAPKATVTRIEKDKSNGWIIFKIEAPQFNNDPHPESQLYYVVQGRSALYTNFVAVKEKTLSGKFTEKWTAIFKKSELVYE